MENINSIEQKILNTKLPAVIEIPFVDYLKDKINKEKVNVVYAVKGRLFAIICKFDNGYQDFYFGEIEGGFKILSENCEDEDGEQMTFRDWWKEEEMGVPCPKEYANEIACMG